MAQPPVAGPSSTASNALVSRNRLEHVSRSSGRSVRRSTTSTRDRPAGRLLGGLKRIGDALADVTTSGLCRPRVRALPSGDDVLVASGAAPLTEYSRLCSRKITGLSSRIAPFSSALGVRGVDGNTIFTRHPWNQVAVRLGVDGAEPAARADGAADHERDATLLVATGTTIWRPG